MNFMILFIIEVKKSPGDPDSLTKMYDYFHRNFGRFLRLKWGIPKTIHKKWTIMVITPPWWDHHHRVILTFPETLIYIELISLTIRILFFNFLILFITHNTDMYVCYCIYTFVETPKTALWFTQNIIWICSVRVPILFKISFNVQ